MFQIASFKIICTDSTEILFLKTKVCWFELSLAKNVSFSLFLTVQGVSNKHCLFTFFICFSGSKNYAAMTTADQVYFTVLDLKKKQFTSMFRGFEPFVDDEVGESIQVRS